VDPGAAPPHFKTADLIVYGRTIGLPNSFVSTNEASHAILALMLKPDIMQNAKVTSLSIATTDLFSNPNGSPPQ
jgi:hypothetical protein